MNSITDRDRVEGGKYGGKMLTLAGTGYLNILQSED